MSTSLLPDWLSWASSVLSSVWSTIASTPIIPLITVMGAVGIAVAALKQARTASDRHQEQTKADQERRITESFSKAIEQLGSDKREVRLGGIYTLERISRESDREYWPIMETLTAYVREHAQWTPRKVLPSRIILPTFSSNPRFAHFYNILNLKRNFR